MAKESFHLVCRMNEKFQRNFSAIAKRRPQASNLQCKNEQVKGKGAQITGKAEITLQFASDKQAKDAYRALLAETDFSHRGGSKLSLSKGALAISIMADDPVSLRASINSYLRLAHIIKAIEQDTS